MGKRMLTDDARATILQLHADGVTRNDIARRTGWSPGLVTKVVHTAGRSFDRAATKAATEARQADNRARRVAIIDRQYGRAEKILDRLDAATFTTLVPAGMGEQAPKDLTFVPPHEEKALAQAVSTHLASAARLEQVDAGDGTGPVRSLLDGVAAALGLHTHTDDEQ